MGRTYKILTPVPQLRLKQIPGPPRKFPLTPIGGSFSFSPKFPWLYRTMVNLAKEKECSDDVIFLLQEAESIFWAEIPSPMPYKSPLLSTVIYSSIADVILHRLFDCMLLFGYVPKPFPRYLWFFASASTKGIDSKSLNFLDLDWNYYDFETRYAEAVQADWMLHGLQKMWNKLSPVLTIESLNGTFTNKKKQDVYLKAGNANILRKMEELVKARYGPDAHFVEPDITDVINESHEEQETNLGVAILPIRPSRRQTTEWFIEGWQRAYFKEIDKIDSKQYKEVSGSRFHRAFQIFTAACRLQNPHRFVALMTCLEALFCTTSRELTFQLASRAAWFLKPTDLSKRRQMFEFVKDLYEIRSKIVHGQKYSMSKVESSVSKLADLVREVFHKILLDNIIYKVIFASDQKGWNRYLESLSLGGTSDKK